MRKIFFLLAVASLVAVVSLDAQDHKTHDSNKPKIEGSGNIITKTVNVQSFDQIDVSGVFSLKLSQGSKEEVKIEADDNLQDLFEVKNDGSKLTIEMKKESNFNSKKGLKVYVTFKKLKSMNLKTVGNVSSEENLSFDDVKIGNKSVGSVDLKLTAQSVDLNNKSVGNVKLNGKAETAVIKNNSVGSIDAGDFVVQKMDIDNKGIGSAEVNAAKEIKVRDSFLGKVNNKGAAPIKRTKKVVI
jgi:Putative auto-transporter adhesin, head GIN domain